MPARFLNSKLFAPQLHPDLVQRRSLVERLRTSSARVWLLSAPPGYGKTTLVSQALEGREAAVVWVSVDRADNDPVRFWTHVAASVMGEGTTLDDLADRLRPDHMNSAVDEVITAIEHLGGPVVLVLDDLHEITDSEITEHLGRIVTRPPANLTVVITARSDPSLPIGRLRSYGQLIELRAQDLAFTEEETGALFDDASRETVAAILEQTEGWPTGLRLLAVSSDGQPTIDQVLQDHRGEKDLGDFLGEEALASLRPELQQFLIETSILDDLCPDSCDTVTGGRGSLAILRELTRLQVFTALVDPPSNTYRYHRLFREFLRRRVEELEPERLRQLHDRAAGWYVAADIPTAAIEHFLAAGDDDHALTTIKTHYGSYAQAGLLATVSDWLEAYGAERCRGDAELRLAAAWAALNGRRYDEVDSWLDVPDETTADPPYRVQAHAIRSHRARHDDNLATAVHEARLAVDMAKTLAGSTPALSSLDYSFAYAALVMAQQLAGEIDLDIVNRAVDGGLTASNDSSVVIGCSSLALAASDDPDRLDEADAFADRALAYTSSPTLERFHQPVAALLAKSKVALAQGRVGDAEELAARAETIAETAVEPSMLALVRCQLARTSHAQGHSDDARKHLRRVEAAVGAEPGTYIAETMRRVRNETRFAHAESAAPIELSKREFAVLRLLPHGLTRKELGAQLFVSENTVKTHMTSLRHKLGVTGRSADIVARANDLGLLDGEASG